MNQNCSEQTGPQPEKDINDRRIASPAARKLASEKGIDLSEVPTIDPLGRVRKQDVTSFSEQPTASSTCASTKSLLQQSQKMMESR